ncbi:potassium channel protein [Providencia rettgeri]
MNPISFLEKDRSMDEKITQFITQISYWFAGLGLFFSGLSLYEWGFLIGVFASVLLGTLTYLLNRREQKRRTRILENYFSNKPVSPEDAEKLIEASIKSPKDL